MKFNNILDKLSLIFRGKKVGYNSLLIMLGENECITVHIAHGQLIHRSYFSKINTETIQSIEGYLDNNTNTNVYVILNNQSQNYFVDSIPKVGYFTTKSLIKQRLNSSKDKWQIQDFIKLHSRSTKDDSYNKIDYLFIGIECNSSITKLSSAIMSKTQKFSGFLALPIAISSTLLRACEQDLQQSKEKIRKKNEDGLGTNQPSWYVFVMFFKVGGIRYIVFKNKQIMLTRITPIDLSSLTANIVAGKISQEFHNNMNYLIRFGFSKQDSTYLYVIASEEIKSSLSKMSFEASETKILTPKELSKILNIPEFATSRDQFCDTIALACIVQSPSIKLLFADFSKIYHTTNYAWNIAQKVAKTCMISSVILTLPLLIQYTYLKNKTTKVIEEQKLASDTVKSLMASDQTKMALNLYNVIAVYKIMEDMAVSPLEQLPMIKDTMFGGVSIKSYSWSIDEYGRVSIKVEFLLPADSSFYDSYALLKAKVNKIFTHSKVEFGGIPSELTLSKKPVSLKVFIIFEK